MKSLENNLMLNNKDVLLVILKDLRFILLAKIKTESKLLTLDQIEVSVEKRIKQLETDKKRMLNSILERETRSININKLLIDN